MRLGESLGSALYTFNIHIYMCGLCGAHLLPHESKNYFYGKITQVKPVSDNFFVPEKPYSTNFRRIWKNIHSTHGHVQSLDLFVQDGNMDDAKTQII